jgi:NAD-dependent dihydropyrimidine dehydrogenase PreA subunit
VAEAAGLGKMGIHRNVIHPRFGNFILLGTVLVAAEVGLEDESRPLDFNPCLTCKLCVAACPVGAIGPDGGFDFSACYTHNYREFMGGFTDWVETVADSRSARDYRSRVRDSESASWWQSLSHGANYKAAYCMAVCPAGEDVIAPFRADRAAFVRERVDPLRAKVEPVYVVPGSDAEAHVTRRFPHKEPRPVGNGLRPTTVAGFLAGMPRVFQRRKAAEVRVRVHFVFTGTEQREATVDIDRGRLDVRDGLHGEADLRVSADARAWVAFLREHRGLLRLLLTRKLRLRGHPRHLRAFGRCFL